MVLLVTTTLVLAASSGAATGTEFIASDDATVTDGDLDGAGDWVYNEQSVVVGYAHPALGPGEHRGVYEFDLGRTAAGVDAATLALHVAGSFVTSDPDPRLIVFVGPGDGQVTAADFAPSPSELAGEVNLYEVGETIDVTTALQVVGPSRFIRVVVAPHPATVGTPGGLLFGSWENELAYGDGYRTARLTIAFQSAQEQVADLIALVNGYQLDKLGTSLTDKLAAVQQSLEANEPTTASENLNAFIQQVEAQAGKRLTPEQATDLRNKALRIEAAIA
jgi:hypothetical protein